MLHFTAFRRTALCYSAALALASLGAMAACAQESLHHLYSGDAPTGTLGQAQLMRGGPRAGYFQPVEIVAPEGAAISLAEEGRFGEPRENRALVGMLIGHVYHLKVTQIPLHEGIEIFPTIELLDRLYPPTGQELRFPIPIELTLEELDHAAQGRYVTRVIYLEDPRTALPVREDEKHQRYYEVEPTRDVLQEADRLGRPMAILRIGSRVPTEADFLEGRIAMSPFMKYRFPAAPPKMHIEIPPGQELPPSEFHPNVPRVEPDQRWTLMPTYLLPQEAFRHEGPRTAHQQPLPQGTRR